MFGEYFELACNLAGMNWAEVAEQSGVQRSTVTKALRSTSQPGTSRPSRDLVLQWCRILHCPDDLETLMLHSLGYASRKEEEEALGALERVKIQIQAQLEQKRDK